MKGSLSRLQNKLLGLVLLAALASVVQLNKILLGVEFKLVYSYLHVHKSDNLQYNRLSWWDVCLIDQVSDVPSIIFFHNFLQKRVLRAISPSQQPTILFSIYQNNTWNIRRLVHETIIPVTQQIILKIDGFHDLLAKLLTLELSM
jgi:hypothetical protein